VLDILYVKTWLNNKQLNNCYMAGNSACCDACARGYLSIGASWEMLNISIIKTSRRVRTRWRMRQIVRRCWLLCWVLRQSPLNCQLRNKKAFSFLYTKSEVIRWDFLVCVVIKILLKNQIYFFIASY